MKFISVLVKAKDNLEKLRKTIKSIENQQINPNWRVEIILLKPHTFDWEKYHPEYLHPNILVLEFNDNEINNQESTIWDIGYKSSSGEFIAFAMEGDIWSLRKLDEQIHIMDCKKTNMVYTYFGDKDKNKRLSSLICKKNVFKKFIKELDWNLGLSLDIKWISN